jgi:hypothetical protein
LYGSALEGRLAQFEELKKGQQPLTARPITERAHGEREN